jgi:serine/threonine-protein kinase
MAAEQAAGRPIYASDLYSLGLVAVFLLTGKLPQSLEIDPGNGEILWRRDVPNCHSNLAGVIDRTIRFHPRDRFSTAREMLDTLKLNTESSEIATQSVTPKRYPIPNNPGVPPTVPFKRKRYRFWNYPAAEEQKQLIAGGLVVGGWLLVALAIGINFNRYQTTSNPVPSPTQTRSELPTIKLSPSPIPAPIHSQPLIAKPSVILPESTPSPESIEYPETSKIPSNPESTPMIAELPKVASTPKQATSSFSQLSSPLKTPQSKPLETPTPLAIPKPLATPTPLVTPTPSPTIEKNNLTHSQIKSIPAFAPGTSKKIVESSLGNPTKQSKGLWPKTRAFLYEEFVPNKVSLGYLFDVNSDRLRQTEASFYQSVELETISETLNQMLNGNITPEIQQGLARIYQGKSNRYRFTTGNHLKVAIERNERDRIYIGVWEADLH